MTSAGRQAFLWQELFTDSTQWWDNRRYKKTPRHPDFRHKKSKDALWLNDWHKPAWVDSQLAIWDLAMCRSPGSGFTSGRAPGPGILAANEGDLEVGRCWKLCEEGQVTEAVDALNLLVQRGCHIPNDLFYLVLKRCIAHKYLDLGRRIHLLIVKSGYEGNAFLATHLIGLYASHGNLDEAKRVFSKVPTPDAYNWASIIFACAKHGQSTQAVRLFRQMSESAVKPDNRIYVAVLKACARARDLAAGKDVHARIVARGGKADMFVQTCLVDMYAKCGSLKDARIVFDRLVEKDVVVWTAMIAGYAQQGMYKDALSLYSCMQEGGMNPPDSVTFVCLLQACASVGVVALQQGKQLYAQIEERGLQDDVVVGSSLVNMFAKCGSLGDARAVFDKLPHRNVVTWTAMIAGYTQQGMGQEALSLYSSMQQEGISPPDSVTFLCLLQACANVGVAALQQGKQLHAQIEERGLQDDVVIGTTVVNMYAKVGNIEEAQKMFDRLKEKDVVTWTAMITGYTQQGMGQEALGLYRSMQKKGIAPPDAVTYVCLLQACAGVLALHEGKQLHVQIEEQGLQDGAGVAASLVNMYAKCGSVEDAQKVFDRLAQKDVVTWNAMIAGYAQQGMGQEALSLYRTMQQEAIAQPDSVTYVSLLQACASVAALPLGKQLHAQIEEQGLQADENVGSSLVNMYAKCGSLEHAHQVFDSLAVRGTVAWSSLIAGYTRQGDSEIVFDLFDRMRQEGIHPNSITFLSVLTVCSHAGLVDKGRHYFDAMVSDYGISPTIEHYACRMDLLGRAGHLVEALQLAKTMPLQPNAAVWLSLMGACQKWSNVEVGQHAFKYAVSLDKKDPASYILMSNIYAGAQMWEEAEEVQARRLKAGAWKLPGQSWCIDMGGVVHTFSIGDRQFSDEGEELLTTRPGELVPI